MKSERETPKERLSERERLSETEMESHISSVGAGWLQKMAMGASYKS